MTEFKYCVYCDEEPAICFDNEAEAMKFAREDTSMYKSVIVEKTEIDEERDKLNSEVIWSASDIKPEEQEANLVKENPFDTDFPESDIAHIDEIDDPDYKEIADQYKEDPTDWIDDKKLIHEAVNTLEENEAEVECKCCFELFPKESCVKTDKGYVCQKCNQELHSHQGTNLDLIDKDPFDLEYDDPRDPDEEEEPEIKEKPFDAAENRKHEEGIEEDLTLKINKDEVVANVGGEDVAIFPTPEAEEKVEDETSIEEPFTAEDEAAWTDEDEAIIESLKEENLEEHVNDRPADIESEQEYQGIDNAVVNCETHTLVTHSEDEKPLDCEMEEPALEEPLAGEEVEVKVNEDLTEENLEEAKKDDELPVDPEAAKLEVHTMLNDLVADEIEAINGYEEAKKEILDTPIAHKDTILDTIDHVEDEEKEHVDELIAATTEIPFDKEEAPAPVVEEPSPVVEEEPVVEEGLKEGLDVNSYRIVLADYNDDNGYDQEDVEYLLKPGQTKSDLVVYLSYKAGFIGVYVHDGRPATEDEIKQSDYLGFETEPIPDGWSVEDFGDTDEDFEESLKNKDPFDQEFPEVEENLDEDITEDLLDEGNIFSKISDWFKSSRLLSNGTLDKTFGVKGYKIQGKNPGEDWKVEKTKNTLKDAVEALEQLSKTHKYASTEIVCDDKIFMAFNKDGKMTQNNIKKIAEETVANTNFNSIKDDKKEPEAAVNKADKDAAVEKETEEEATEPTTTKRNMSKQNKARADYNKLAKALEILHIDPKVLRTEDGKITPEFKELRKVLFEESLEESEDLDERAMAEVPFDSEVKVGDKIKIIHLGGEDDSYDGRKGTVDHIDSIGQLHGTWGGLAVIPGVDEFEIINEELTEDIKNYAKAEDFLKNPENKWKWLDLEWETERDIFGISIDWNADKNCFKAYTSVYHASEDNNAEYPERHTDEEEYSADTLEELYKELSEEFGEEFVKAFESELNSKQLTEASSADKKAFKNGGEAYDDLINGTAIGMIKDPKARAAAVAALKAGRKDLLKAYIGDRHENAAIDLLDKKQAAMANAGMTDESLKEDYEEDEVECGWCHEQWPESDCRYEKDFGYLCPQCEAELKSRGEELIFIEPAPKDECLHEDKDPNRELSQQEIDAVINKWSDEDKNSIPAAKSEDKDWTEIKDAIIKDMENTKPIEKAELTPEEATKAEKETDNIVWGWN